MRAWAKEITQNTLMKWNGVHNFQQKVNLTIDAGPYILKTAESYEELIASFKLRHEVFYKELQSIEEEGIDFDKFDALFDHLIIIHKSTNEVIGTYRVNCSNFSSESYTKLEFNLDKIFTLNGPYLELGRACIEKDHRKGTVLALLWRGITDYMNLTGSNILFGCSSLKIKNINQIALVYRYLFEQGALMEEDFSLPTKKFKMPDFDLFYSHYQTSLTETQKDEAGKLIPPLLKSYIKFGAKIAGPPAFDKDFDCVDLLTILKKEDMTNFLARRFQIIQ